MRDYVSGRRAYSFGGAISAHVCVSDIARRTGVQVRSSMLLGMPLAPHAPMVHFFSAAAFALLSGGLGGAATDGDPIHLGTGLYVRTSVDLVVDDTVPITFSRTYRTGDRLSRPFGIGANHSYGSFLVGDAPALTWIDLILPDGGRIHYRRTSSGAGLHEAIFRNTDSPTEYLNSVLSFDGADWILKLQNGTRFSYLECPPEMNKACTMNGYEDPEGHRLKFTHDDRFNLVRIETEHQRWLQLEYDRNERIVRAWTSEGDEARYRYDAGGRLVQVIAADGEVNEYEYDERDSMVTFREPGVLGINKYDGSGRCIHQELVFSDAGANGEITEERQIFRFAYTTDAGGRILAADVVRRDNSRRHVTYDAHGYVSGERIVDDRDERGIIYVRDEQSLEVRELTVWCGRDQRVRVSARIQPGEGTATVSAHERTPAREDPLDRLNRTCGEILKSERRRSN
jgi:YD repeat-containing protein